MDNNTQQPDEELMRYVDKEMNSEERAAFETRVMDNDQLSTAVKDLNIARKAITTYGIQQQVSSVHEAWKKENTAAPVVKMNPYRKIIGYSIAAAACFLLVLLAVNKFNAGLVTPDSLYASAYSPFEPTATRGSGESLSAVENAFTQKDYHEVIRLFKATPATATKDQLMAGIAFLQTGAINNAIENFRSIIQKNTEAHTKAYNDEAEYYLALSYLKSSNYPAALTLMQKIHRDSGNAYSEKFSEGFIEKVGKLKK